MACAKGLVAYGRHDVGDLRNGAPLGTVTVVSSVAVRCLCYLAQPRGLLLQGRMALHYGFSLRARYLELAS